MRRTAFIKWFLKFLKLHWIFKMAAPIQAMFKYSIVRNFLNSPPILIKYVSKFMVRKVLYFEAQYALRLRSPLRFKRKLQIFDTESLFQIMIFTNSCSPCHSYTGRAKRICYLSPMRAAKVQASLRIRAVSPEPSLLAHTSSELRGTFRQKAKSLAPLNGWACAVKICHDGMLEDTNSLGGAHTCFIFSRRGLFLNSSDEFNVICL